jgi:hypothetical protein
MVDEGIAEPPATLGRYALGMRSSDNNAYLSQNYAFRCPAAAANKSQP